MVEHIARGCPRPATVIFGAGARAGRVGLVPPPPGIANAARRRALRASPTPTTSALPTCDVFDEDRYFVAGDAPLRRRYRRRARRALDLRGPVAGRRRGLLCSRYQGREDPVEALIAAGAQVIVPLRQPVPARQGRAPRHTPAHAARCASPSPASTRSAATMNCSSTVTPRPTPPTVRPGLRPGLRRNRRRDRRPARCSAAPPPPDRRRPIRRRPIRSSPLRRELLFRAAMGVRDYCRKTGFSKVVLGLSGGIDSAVTGVLAAAASVSPSPGRRPPVEVLVRARSPMRGHRGQPRRAVRGHPHQTRRPSATALHPSSPPPGRPSASPRKNLQSRVRHARSWRLSNKLDRLLLTTGNKTRTGGGLLHALRRHERRARRAQRREQSSGSTASRWMNAHPAKLGIGTAPGRTLDRPPSGSVHHQAALGGTAPHQVDRDSLPPYDLLDRIIECYVGRCRRAPLSSGSAPRVSPRRAVNHRRDADRPVLHGRAWSA